MMECGQYNEMWSEIHMMPEQTVQASIDLGAKVMMPIHWASFKLALHPWSDPVKKATKHAELLKFAITTPKIGEEIIVGEQDNYPVINWWEGI